ncbi:hypothetical protein NEOKW01_0358 [Nematocida sp. AWRm80]|nr:hypothetical protein NEOKW01_0358 [Nematocida sp. AWRm80]
MPTDKEIKEKINAYKETISLLQKQIKKLEDKLTLEASDEESIEEGEIREDPTIKKKRKITEVETIEIDQSKLEQQAKKQMPEVLKEILDIIDTASEAHLQKRLEILMPYLDNTIKYILLHDILLFSRKLDRYSLFYSQMYPKGIEKDSSEVSIALEQIYNYTQGIVSEEKLKESVLKIVSKYNSTSVISGSTISQTAFDAATSIRLYTKVLDWNWTYNEFIREHLYLELRKPDRPFPVYVLSILFVEWNRSLAAHKSHEHILQTLDRIAGVGHGENIIDSPYEIESQLASALVLRQFRPGAAVKWNRKRISEAETEKEKEYIENAWLISII